MERKFVIPCATPECETLVVFDDGDITKNVLIRNDGAEACAVNDAFAEAIRVKLFAIEAATAQFEVERQKIDTNAFAQAEKQIAAEAVVMDVVPAEAITEES